MKRIVILLLSLAFSVAASAQYASAPQGYLETRGAKVFCNGQRLSPDQAAVIFSDMGGVDRSADYLKYRKGYRAGVGLAVGGASAIMLGSLLYTTSAVAALVVGIPMAFAGEPMPIGIDIGLYGGVSMAAAGLAVMIAGIPTAVVYQGRIKDMAAACNTSSAFSPSVTVGPTRSGLGLALNF